MFEDIAQMEKDRETFRKNVVASSELVEGIIQLTEATNQQKEAVAKASDSLGREVESCVAQIKKDHATALRTLNDENKSTIIALQENLSAEQASRLSELDRLKNDLKEMQSSYSAAAESLVKRIESCIMQIKEDHAIALRALNDENKSTINALQENLSAEQASRLSELDQLKNELLKMQASYVEKLNQTDHAIQEYQRNAEIQYNDFVRRLETTNVDQIFREVQELKQSVKAKFLLLMGGIGFTLIATVLNFFMK